MKSDKHVTTRIRVEQTSVRRSTEVSARGTSWVKRLRLHDWILRSSLVVAIILSANCAGPTSTPTQSTAAVTGQLQLNLSRNGSSTTMGEPEIAVDPQSSDELFVYWTTFPHPLTISGAGANIADPCGGLVSLNSGESWHSRSGADEPCPLYEGMRRRGRGRGPRWHLVRGRHRTDLHVHWGFWSLRSDDPRPGLRHQLVELGSHLESSRRNHGFGRPTIRTGHPVDTFDRPWLAVDQSTGTVYAAGHNLADHEAWVTASTNKARSFGAIYPIDSPTYPSEGFSSSNIVAAHGVLAEAYAILASTRPDLSVPHIRDEHRPRSDIHTPHRSDSVNGSSSPEPFLAADSTVNGRFALTILDSTGKKNQVYVSGDSGATWQGPAIVGESPPNPRFKPWITFGTSGNLALVWRTQYANGGYDVWAALGHDAKAATRPFSVRPSESRSVAAPYPSGYAAGDDFSWIITDAHYAHVGWGDSRNGPVQVWYGRIPLSSTPKG